MLIADDHPALMTAVSRLLAMDCDVVGEVVDGALLLQEAQRLQPDVIVLDVNLPNVNGIEACRQITQAHPRIGVIVFTAVVDSTTKDRALAAGAAAFVSKLSGATDLLAEVERLGHLQA